MKNKFPPILFSLPVIDRLSLPPRAEILPRIESGELDHIDFVARVFNTAPNTNHYAFPPASLSGFASSFEDQPYLRNHDTYDIDARDGTILESALDGNDFRQTIRLTTRRGMTDLVEGKIDRFSIGWFYKDVLCSICNTSIYACSHVPGRDYAGKLCELIFTEPRGKETSAVNAAAVPGTGIEALLQYQAEFSTKNTNKHEENNLVSFPSLVPLRVIRGEDSPEIIGGTSPAVIRQGGLRPPLPLTNAPGASYSLSAAQRHSSKGAQMKKHVKRNGVLLEVEESEVLSTDEIIADPALTQLEANRQAAAELLGETQRQVALDAQLEASNQVLIAQCAHLLESGLSASRLPEVVQSRIRKTFEGQAFKAADLTAAISEARDEVAALTAGQTVHGPSRVSGMWSGSDQLTLAVEDLLGVERLPADKDKKVARLSGIREAYLLLTGDRDFVGGSFPEFSLGDTSTFPVIVKNALNKRLENAWAKYGAAGYDWWQKIVAVEHFETLQQIDWLITGTIGSLPTVAEKGEYTELPIGDNGETSDWTKYGGYIGLTLEAILRDDVRAFKRLPDELAMGGIRNISAQVAAIFTANSAVGPTLSDTGALFNATAQTTKGGHKNLLTTALGTDLVAWRAVEAAMYKQPMHVMNATGQYGTGKNQAVKPRYCLVPMDLKGASDDLFLKNWTASGPNLSYGQVEPVVVPDWTDATDWAAVADPAVLPGIMLGEIFGVMPQVVLAGNESDPAMFSNDESRLKVRQFLTVGIANWRALSKNNVAG